VISAKAKMVAKIGIASLGLSLALAPLLARQAEAPAAAAPAAGPAAGNAEKGKAIYETASCGACHNLAAAGGGGDIGPALDKNPNLTHALIVSRVKDGQGAMPPFAGQLSEEDIENVAAYVLGASEK
jgi:mono/diheme cytochrome c family protein